MQDCTVLIRSPVFCWNLGLKFCIPEQTNWVVLSFGIMLSTILIGSYPIFVRCLLTMPITWLPAVSFYTSLFFQWNENKFPHGRTRTYTGPGSGFRPTTSASAYWATGVTWNFQQNLICWKHYEEPLRQDLNLRPPAPMPVLYQLKLRRFLGTFK